MDPFDDYDPQAYDYDESDTEDDIVYLEGPVQGEDPFLPYLAKGTDHSQSQLSQSSLQEQQPEAPTLLPRRERQRRRNEQAAAEMMAESSDSEQSNHPPENEERDTFASLQSLLEKQSQQAREMAAGKASNEQDETQQDVGAAEKEEAEKVPAVEGIRPFQEANTNDETVHESQSQFPVADDWEPSQQAQPNHPSDRAKHVPLVTNSFSDYIGGPSSISSGLTKELQRHWKPKSTPSVTSSDRPTSVVDSKLLSELDKSRKRIQKNTLATSRPKKRDTKPQYGRKRSVTKVASSKSIVGTRPQHWGAAGRKASGPTKKTRKLAVSPNSSFLAASARKSRSSLSRPATSSVRPHNAVLNRISFVPHFFHSKTSLSQQDDVDESTQRSEAREVPLPYQTPRILQRFNQNSTAAYSAGSGGSDSGNKRKRKQQANKKLKAGPLMKRLRALRSAVDGDMIRFQSGMYPFAQSATRRFDLSDPRNRARSIMDVSIVCEPVPWDEHERITVLGFVHRNEKVAKKAARVGDTEPEHLVESGRFVWLCFTYDTACEQSIRKGSKLRIYNAVSIPSRSAIQIDGYGDRNLVEDRCCDHTILCTQLCEQYPESLPELPDIIQTAVNGAS